MTHLDDDFGNEYFGSLLQELGRYSSTRRESPGAFDVVEAKE